MDILSHIGENRNETIAIPFFGWIKNPVEMMINYVMESGNAYEWGEKYPVIRSMVSLGNDKLRLFHVSSIFSIKNFLDKMCESEDKLDKRDIEKDFTELISNVDPKFACPTAMEAIMQRLLSENFVNSVYIYAPWFSDKTKEYIKLLFKNNLNKIYLSECGLKGIIESTNNASTLFVENVDDLMDIIQATPDNDPSLQSKWFVVSALPSLESKIKDNFLTGHVPENFKPAFMYQDYLNTMPTRFNSKVDFMQLKAVMPRKVNTDDT